MRPFCVFFFTINSFPNPTSDLIGLEIEAEKILGPVQIDIVDVIGRSVFVVEDYVLAGTNHVSIDLSDINQGLYFLRIKLEDQVLAIEKIYKQ